MIATTPPVPHVAAAITPDAAAPLVELPAVWRHGQIAAGDHVCAVRGDGRVMCWGQNSHGEVGDEPRTPHVVPVLVPNVEHVASVAVGPGVSCAVETDGHVTCWGGFDATKWQPRRIAGLDDVVEIAALSGSGCARRRDGSVWCWSTAQPPAPIPELGRARRLVAGYTFACVLGDDDHTRCIAWWSGKDNTRPFQVFDITDATGAVQLGALYSGACGVLRTGGITCWSFVDTSGPPGLTVRTIAAAHDAIDVEMGLHGTCAALRGGGAVCFDSDGATAKPMPWAADYRALAIGHDVLCGADASGAITCWGSEASSLGRYPIGGTQPPTDVAAAVADEIAVEDDAACARRGDGSVACWTDGKALEQIAVPRAAHLVAGHRFACAVTSGGKQSCWGTLTWAGCHFRSRDNCQPTHAAKPVEVRPFDVANLKAVADPCALDGAGHVQCSIGSRATKSITIGGVDNATSASARCAVMRGRVACWTLGADAVTATPIDGITNAVQVVAGGTHDCALLATGAVLCWGDNGQGQLGDGTRRARTSPAPVAGLADVVELAAGAAFTCARQKGGTVACWGSNAGAALGDGSGRDQAKPVAVATVGDAFALRAAGEHACVLRKRGRVTCWGHVATMLAEGETHVTVPEPDVLE
jgi:hypothetical protein